MPTFVPTSGGYSLAKRGIVALASGEKVFVKLATEENSQRFIPKEIVAYKWLKEKSYKHIPELLLSRADGIVLPDLSKFDWSNLWTEKKLTAVLKAIDELSELPITKEDRKRLPPVIVANGWQELQSNPKLYTKLMEKLGDYPKLKTAIKEHLNEYIQICDNYQANSAEFKPIHADIRADNLAYDETTDDVYIVDWNWMGLGNKGMEDVGLLVNVAHSGFDVEAFCPERLDKRAALLLTGFWLFHSTERIWTDGDPRLRDLQFRNALQAARFAGLI